MRRNSNWLKKRIEETRRIKQYSIEEYSYPAKTNEIKTGKLIKLDANENFFISQDFYAQIFRDIEYNLDPRLYPQNEKKQLINALSEYTGLPYEYITIGNGSDELIETVIRVFLRSSERCISVSPTFNMYKIIVEAHGNTYHSVPLGQDFSLDEDALLSKTTVDTILCILCSPNNPTGNQLELSSVLKILEEFEGIVVVDEAYVEFAPHSIKDMIEEFDNLIILRTFSKAFGLAGLRIGYALSSPKITSVLNQIQLPYHINKFSLRVASEVLKKRKFALDAVESIKIERSRLINRLNNIAGIKAFNSDANFILFKIGKNIEAVFNKLKNREILIRKIGNVTDFGSCFRVSVGTPVMNDYFINALEDICNE